MKKKATGRPPVPPVEKQTITLGMEKDLHARLKAAAKKDNRSMSRFIIEAVQRYISEVEKR